MTEFRVETVRIGAIEKHPNADTLSITKVHGGYPVCFKTGTYSEGDLATYVPVDALVPVAHKAFAFLDSGKGRTHERIKAKKLRGVFSMGLLVGAVPGAKEGDLVDVKLGVLKYETPEERKANGPGHQETRSAKKVETAAFDSRVIWTASVLGGASLGVAAGCGSFVLGAILVVAIQIGARLVIGWNRARNRKPNVPVYDIEGLRRHSHVFNDGEEVWVTEKVHGCNASFVHTGKRFFVRSRTMFREDVKGNPGPNRKETGDDVWWLVAKRLGLESKLRGYPNLVLFGEVYGDVQDLHYGVPTDERVRFVAFDAMDLKTRKYLDVDEFLEFCKLIDVPVAPTLYRGPFSADVANMAEGPSVMPGANHVREGIVIKPIKERHDMRVGRVFLKLAGQGYLLRKDEKPVVKKAA